MSKNTCRDCPSFYASRMLMQAGCSRYDVCKVLDMLNDSEIESAAKAVYKICFSCDHKAAKEEAKQSVEDDLISREAAMRLLRYELDFLGSRETNAAVEVIRKMPAARRKE